MELTVTKGDITSRQQFFFDTASHLEGDGWSLDATTPWSLFPSDGITPGSVSFNSGVLTVNEDFHVFRGEDFMSFTHEAFEWGSRVDSLPFQSFATIGQYNIQGAGLFSARDTEFGYTLSYEFLPFLRQASINVSEPSMLLLLLMTIAFLLRPRRT